MYVYLTTYVCTMCVACPPLQWTRFIIVLSKTTFTVKGSLRTTCS